MVTKKKPVKRAAPAQAVETAAPAFKPKKSVALSGVTAGACLDIMISVKTICFLEMNLNKKMGPHGTHSLDAYLSKCATASRSSVSSLSVRSMRSRENASTSRPVTR